MVFKAHFTKECWFDFIFLRELSVLANLFSGRKTNDAQQYPTGGPDTVQTKLSSATSSE